jgi:hypothetical protein
MSRSNHRFVVVLSVVTAVSLAACGQHAAPPAAESAPAAAPAPSAPGPALPPSTPAQPPRAGAPVLADFEARVKDHVELRHKLEDTLPKLSNQSTPDEIDKHQRALGRLVQQARKGAQPGTVFTPGMRTLVRQVLADVFGGPDGAALEASIMDENPGLTKLTVNARYPDTVPLSTVPPQVLQRLPRLPEDLEFRFIGPHFILMDEHAHIIVDLIENVLPQ